MRVFSGLRRLPRLHPITGWFSEQSLERLATVVRSAIDERLEKLFSLSPEELLKQNAAATSGILANGALSFEWYHRYLEVPDLISVSNQDGYEENGEENFRSEWIKESSRTLKPPKKVDYFKSPRSLSV